jgi:hypothetical protein
MPVKQFYHLERSVAIFDINKNLTLYIVVVRSDGPSGIFLSINLYHLTVSSVPPADVFLPN